MSLGFFPLSGAPISAVGRKDSTANFVGASSTGAAGTVSGEGDSSALFLGASATCSAGAVAGTGTATANFVGASATCSAGIVTGQGDSSALFVGVSATGAAQDITPTNQLDATASFLGASATCSAADVTGTGDQVAAAVAGHARSHKKTQPKRRKFVFDNGVTVWATDERMARLLSAREEADPAPQPEASKASAGSRVAEDRRDAPPDPIEFTPIDDAPARTISLAISDAIRSRREAEQLAQRELIAREEAARLAKEEADRAELERLLRIEAIKRHEAAVVAYILMSDAPLAAGSTSEHMSEEERLIMHVLMDDAA